MTSELLFGATSIVCFSLPIAAILYCRLYRHISLIALMLYYAVTIMHCLGSSVMPPTPDLHNTGDVLYNYIEIPLMFSALLFFCTEKHQQRNIQSLIGFFFVYEIAIVILFGFSPLASLYIMTPGLVVLVAYSLYLFVRLCLHFIVHRKNAGRLLMIGALLFSFSSYLFVFYSYFVEENTDITNIYALHFASSSVAAVMMSVGLYMMRQRTKELQDLKVTRRELQTVFGG